MNLRRFNRRNRGIVFKDGLIRSLDGDIVLGILFDRVVWCWLTETVITVFIVLKEDLSSPLAYSYIAV